MREDRENILLFVLSKIYGGERLVSMKSNDLKGDHNKISRALSRMGVKDRINVSKDPDRGLLWFKKK